MTHISEIVGYKAPLHGIVLQFLPPTFHLFLHQVEYHPKAGLHESWKGPSSSSIHPWTLSFKWNWVVGLMESIQNNEPSCLPCTAENPHQVHLISPNYGIQYEPWVDWSFCHHTSSISPMKACLHSQYSVECHDSDTCRALLMPIMKRQPNGFQCPQHAWSHCQHGRF
jgi:hypothetical protein